MRRKKVVSKSQFRFFRDILRRIEAGGESPVKDMTADDLRYALADVDFASLPERAGQAAPKPKPKPRPTMPVAPPPPPLPPPAPEGVLSLEVYRTRHPEKAVSVEDGEPARFMSFEGYLRRHPEKKNRSLPPEIGEEWFPALFKKAEAR